MYGSRCTNDLDDDYPCEEILVSREVLCPEPLPRKKGKKEKCYQRCSIEDSTPCCVYSDSREEIQAAKPREMDSKPSLTLKDTKMKKSTRQRISKKRDEIYNEADLCCYPDCSIIYSNPFDEDDQMADDLQSHSGYCTSRMTENMNWIESDSSLHAFPVKEKQKRCSSASNIQRTFDFQDDPLKGLLPAIPSIPRYNLPDTVETKPEPEVLATALLMSENEDLKSTRPAEIFDKLFTDSPPQKTFPTTDTSLKRTGNIEAVVSPIAMAPMMDTDDTNQTTEENTIDETSVSAVRDSQINETVQQDEGKAIDNTRRSSPPTVSTKNREEPMEDDGMLEYLMKAEAASPAYRNYVRLNGSVKPSWFAGYALVSPLLPDCIRITSDPGEALLEAWRLCRPRHFDEFSKSFLNTA